MTPTPNRWSKVVATVEQCPSGALSYSIDSQEHRNRDAEPCIMIAPNGPYAVKGGSGILTAVQLVEGDGASLVARKACAEAQGRLREELEQYGLDAYPMVVAAPDLRVAATTLLQSWGVGPIRSNTVLLNWYDSRGSRERPTLSLWYARLLQRAARLNQHVVVLDADDADWSTLKASNAETRRIDVWWFDGDSSRLALLFADLMTRSDDWDEATIRVIAPAPTSAVQKTESSLRQRLDELRIDADIEVVPLEESPAMYAISSDASLVLLPLRLEGMSTLHPTGGGPVHELFPTLPVVAMVAAFGDVQLTSDDDVEAVPAETPAATGASPDRLTTLAHSSRCACAHGWGLTRLRQYRYCSGLYGPSTDTPI